MAEIPNSQILQLPEAENNISKYERYSAVLKKKIIILTNHLEKNQMELDKLNLEHKDDIGNIEVETKVAVLTHEIDTQQKLLKQMKEKLFTSDHPELTKIMEENVKFDDENSAVVDDFLSDSDIEYFSPLDFIVEPTDIDTKK